MLISNKRTGRWETTPNKQKVYICKKEEKKKEHSNFSQPRQKKNEDDTLRVD